MNALAQPPSPADFRLLIGGHLVPGASSFEVINPATERVLAVCPRADLAQLNQAVAAARAAHACWAASGQPLGVVRAGVARTDRPFRGDVRSHFVEIGLGVLDQLGPVISHQPKEYLLGYILQVRGRDGPLPFDKLAQRGLPLARPVGQAVVSPQMDFVRGNDALTGSGLIHAEVVN